MGSGGSKNSSKDGQKEGKKNAKTYIIKSCQEHSAGINCMCVIPDGTMVITGSEDKTVRIWDTQSEECVSLLKGHESYINWVTCNEKYIFTASADKTIKKWNIETGINVKTFKGHTAPVNRLILIGNILFSSSYDRSARCWETDNGECLRVFQGHKRGVYPLLYVPSGSTKEIGYNYADVDNNEDYLVTGSVDCTAKLWAMNSNECILSYRGHEGAVLCLATDATGKYLYTGSVDGSCRSWDTMTGKPLKTFNGHQAAVISLQV